MGKKGKKPGYIRGRRRWLKTYKVYGHDRGSKEKDRYLFTISGYNKREALGYARNSVKGAKVITRLVRQRY